ncbi:MAG: DNA cytosine methyltransferase [Bacteroidota bacterium]|nr:DNA cytosine methyltransferase [Bacteroidota bacterium]
MNYIDLFAGTSALSEGFIRNGMNPVAHIEMDIEACLTIKTRVAYHHLKSENKLPVYYDYISGKISREELYSHLPKDKSDSIIHTEISDDTLQNIFGVIRSNLKNQKNKKIDLIIGGPPCQAYSLIGRHAIDWEKDNRVSLYKQYGKFLKEFQPKVFVFENVPGLTSANGGHYFQDLKKYFAQLGYITEDKTLNAKDYGVLQHRKRVIIIGWKKNLKFSYPKVEPIIHNFTTKNIFSDLAPLTPGKAMQIGKYKKEKNEYLDRFDLRNGVDFYTQHICRPHNENDLKIYKLAIENFEKKKRIKYTDIPKELQTQKNTGSFLDRFKVVDGKGISHTVVAHIAKDGHYYIHPGKKQCRSISVREAARLQSFPDDFYFEGSRTAAFRQIGNAVPPLMANAIAKAIKKNFFYST